MGTIVKQILKGLDINVESDTVSTKKQSAHGFVGIVLKKDAKLMKKAIEEGCEKIHPDDWK